MKGDLMPPFKGVETTIKAGGRGGPNYHMGLSDNVLQGFKTPMASCPHYTSVQNNEWFSDDFLKVLRNSI